MQGGWCWQPLRPKPRNGSTFAGLCCLLLRRLIEQQVLGARQRRCSRVRKFHGAQALLCCWARAGAGCRQLVEDSREEGMGRSYQDFCTAQHGPPSRRHTAQHAVKQPPRNPTALVLWCTTAGLQVVRASLRYGETVQVIGLLL